jgi:transposase-like protein
VFYVITIEMAESSLPVIELEVEETVEDTSSSSSKKRSQVYQYFTYKLSRWSCNHCSKNFSDKATSALWRHINKVHPKLIEHEKVKEGEMDKYITSDIKENVSLIF